MKFDNTPPHLRDADFLDNYLFRDTKIDDYALIVVRNVIGVIRNASDLVEVYLRDYLTGLLEMYVIVFSFFIFFIIVSLIVSLKVIIHRF